MPDLRRRLPALIAGLILAAIVGGLAVVVSPIPSIAILSVLLGFVAHVVCQNTYHRGP